MFGGPASVALSWSGLQGAFVYPSPRPSRGEGSWSLRSDVATPDAGNVPAGLGISFAGVEGGEFGGGAAGSGGQGSIA